MNPTQGSVLSHVRTEGDLISPDLFVRILDQDPDLPGLLPEDYGLAPGERINDAVNRSWQRMTLLWRHFSSERERLTAEDTGTTVTRQNLLFPLLDELGYGTRPQAATAAQRTVTDREGRQTSYAISHFSAAFPMHLLGCNVGLDARTRGLVGAAQASPHSMVQEFLNLSGAHLWGLVSNGLVLRLLRNSASLSRQAYVEFDLAGILGNAAFPDFALLWMTCHASRVEPRARDDDPAPSPEGCLLERWSRASQTGAVEALDRLSGLVAKAADILGKGFLESAVPLRDRLNGGDLPMQAFYHQLLRLVYRLIFLFVAEDRDLIHAPGTPQAVRERYDANYSMRRLRALAASVPGSRHHDLYEQLKLTMRLLGSETGCAPLGISPMGGFLWSHAAMPDLEDATLGNDALLRAVRSLAFFAAADRTGTRARPVDYEHLGARELGSIYEFLLEQHPILDGGVFELRIAAGNERKRTGAYYTPQCLIDSLLETALDPVVARAAARPDPEAALLGLKVCDPACGSGHFLLGAARRIAERLASVRSGDLDPSPAFVRKALRDVIDRCVYGIDINPMSVELCKISLWMEAMEPGKPLSFLDHHVVCGNSLLGTTPELILAGLPDEAFATLGDADDRKAAALLRKRNRTERRLLRTGLMQRQYESDLEAVRRLTAGPDLDAMPSDTPAQIGAKEAAFRDYRESAGFDRRKLLSDMWCAAFVMERRTDRTGEAVGITQNTIRDFARGAALPADVEAEVRDLAARYRFLHPDLAFPEVADKGGFDAILGNPPWERIKIQEKEWFAARVPEIADAMNAAARKRMIAELPETHPGLYRDFLNDLRVSFGTSHFIRNSGRYPLCGCGDVNMYSVFAENMRSAVNPHGRVGCVVPSGIATDDTTKAFFRSMVRTGSLVSLFDFENKGIFPAIDSRIKFCLLTTGSGAAPLARKAEFVFFAHSTGDVADPDKRFPLSRDDIARMNPNTLTCPIFRTRRDAELTKAVYRRVPILVREARTDADGKVVEPERNPWGIRFGTMFHMSNDSHLFRTKAQLERAEGDLDGNAFHVGKGVSVRTDTGPLEVREGRWLPLYEAKMVHHYNHRWATYEGEDVRDVAPEELADPEFVSMPRYWVHEAEVRERLGKTGWNRGWLMGWRDITNNTNERTVIFDIFPMNPVGHTCPILLSSKPEMLPLLQSNLASLCLDYSARQKIGGTHLTYGYLNQLCLFPPSVFAAPLPGVAPSSLSDFIRPRILELTYTARDMKPFAEDLGHHGDPFPWDEDRRFRLRAELDALFFHLYLPAEPDGSWRRADGETDAEFAALKEAFPTPRDAVSYVMGTFPIVERNDVRRYGTYRTKDGILRVYDAMQAAMRDGTVYRSPLHPA